MTLGLTLNTARVSTTQHTDFSTEIVDNLRMFHRECFTMILELTLPWPPSVNHYKKVGKIVQTKTGKLYQQRINTNETKMFYYQVWMRVKPKTPKEGFKFRNSDEIALSVDVYLYPPNERRYDIDNRLKVLLDSLMHAKVIADDSQIHRLFVQKMDTIESGQVIVRVSELVRS